MEIDVELGLKEVHYCECIGNDIGYGCREEDVRLWSGVGGNAGTKYSNNKREILNKRVVMMTY